MRPQAELTDLFEAASARLDVVDSPSDAEEEMQRFLSAVEESPEHRAFVVGLFKQAIVGSGPPLELLQFCFHALRWSEIDSFLTDLMSREEPERRPTRQIWLHLLDSLRDDWPDAEFYKRFGAKAP
jgi:hypothetical protein